MFSIKGGQTMFSIFSYDHGRFFLATGGPWSNGHPKDATECSAVHYGGGICYWTDW